METKNNNEAVGYGKPPQSTKFKKGQSGNIRGRPKNRPNLVKVLEKALREKVVINENGQVRTITKLEASVKQMVDRATTGDARAMQQLAALVRSGEERPGEVAAPVTTLTEVDQKVMQNVLRRIKATFHGAEDAKSDGE